MRLKTDLESLRQTVAWRRCDGWEALERFFRIFSIFSFLHVSWDALSKDTIDFENAFILSLSYAFGFAVASLIIKTKPVYI